MGRLAMKCEVRKSDVDEASGDEIVYFYLVHLDPKFFTNENWDRDEGTEIFKASNGWRMMWKCKGGVHSGIKVVRIPSEREMTTDREEGVDEGILYKFGGYAESIEDIRRLIFEFNKEHYSNSEGLEMEDVWEEF